ncbi:leucine-rich repeat domain-containing protein [Acidisarcina polymorpha]|nr:leucine-rich repeat domain-containing protein [Acidisarcina polymorpha]
MALIAVIIMGTGSSLIAQTFLQACTQSDASKKDDDGLSADVDSLKTATASFVGNVEGFNCTMYDRALKKMHGLQLSGHNFHHLELLQDMHALESLDISRNGLTTASGVGHLSHLKAIDVSLNNISDITELPALSNLESLRMEDNQVNDIHAIAALGDLRELWADFNSISDISPIGNLPNLLWVHLSSNKIERLSGFETFLSTPGIFDISNNEIKDFGLLDETLRKRVIITGNPAQKEQLDALLTKVPAMIVELYGDTLTVESIKDSYAEHKDVVGCPAPSSVTYKSGFDFTRYSPACGPEW